MPRLPLLLLIVLLAACDRGSDRREAEPQAVTATTPKQAATSATPADADHRIVARTPQLDFKWQVPTELTAHPELLAALRAEALAARAAAAETARIDAEGRTADLPFRPHSHDERWVVTARTPQLLALQGTTRTYMGGAHDSLTLQSLFVDRRTGKRLRFAELFDAPADALGWLNDRYCGGLDAARLERRGERFSGEELNACPPLAEQPIALDGGPDGLIEQVRVLLAPGVAGSNAEGSYEIVVAADASLASFAKPAYRDAFIQRN